MSIEDQLALVETEHLINALKRRSTASLILLVREGEVPKANELLTRADGDCFQVIGLAALAPSVASGHLDANRRR